MKHALYALFTFLPLLLAAPLDAQVRFTAQPERTRTTLDQPIRVTVVLVSPKDLGSFAAPALQSTEQFTVMRVERNQSSSSTINIINGRTERKTEITYLFYYTIAPKQLGSFTFPALSVAIDNEQFSTTPFQVEVLKEVAQKPDVIARLKCAKTRLYIGEQTVLTVIIGHKPGAPAQLTSEGFRLMLNAISEAASGSMSLVDITKGKLGGTEEILEGERYVVYKYSFGVVPIASGELNLGPLPLQFHILRQVRRRDPFDDFFGGSFFGGGVEATPGTVMSNTLRFSIQALPPAPADFSGSVGALSITSDVSPRSVPAGEAVTYKIAIKAACRPGSLADIKFPQLSGLEVFTPEKTTAADTSQNGISTRRTYKYMLIPRTEGTVTIPPITLSYFDPASAQYKQVSTEPVSLTVTKGSGAASPARRYLTQEDIRQVGQDIRFIKKPQVIKNESANPHRSITLYLVNIIPLLIMVFSLLYRIQADRLARDPTLSLRRGAYRTVRRSLDALSAEKDTIRFLGKLTAALDTYITQRFGFAATGMTVDELSRELTSRGAPESLSATLRDMYQQADALRFGGNSVAAGAGAELARNAESIAEQLETLARRSKR